MLNNIQYKCWPSTVASYSTERSVTLFTQLWT